MPPGGPARVLAAAACCHAASHSKSAALGPPAEAAPLSHSDSDGPNLTRNLAWPGGSAWRPGAASLACSAPAGLAAAPLLAGGPAGAGEAALSAEQFDDDRRPSTGSRLFYISSSQWTIISVLAPVH